MFYFLVALDILLLRLAQLLVITLLLVAVVAAVKVTQAVAAVLVDSVQAPVSALLLEPLTP